MRKTPSIIILVTVLTLGLGLGEVAWMRLGAVGCREWQDELQKRVEAYARMHLDGPALQVQMQSTCGHPFVADALYFRWNKLLWRLGWRETKPLEEAELRLSSLRELMQHPDMGTLKITVRLDTVLSQDARKRVEGLIERYLLVESPRQKLEFKKFKKLPEQPAAQGSISPLEAAWSMEPAFHPPMFPAPEPLIRPSLLKTANRIFAILLVCAGGLFVLRLLQSMLWPRRKKIMNASHGDGTQPGSFAILVAPRVLRDLGERACEVWRLLLQVDRERAGRRVLHHWEKDREGLFQFLGWVDGSTQESMLGFLNTDQLLQLTDKAPVALQSRDAQRAGLRILLDLARELGLSGQLAGAPPFIHLMSKREWQRVAQQMSRPRRRALAELLDKERAGWLRGRQDLHPGWFQSGSKEEMTPDHLVRRVRAILQADAEQLRSQLHGDRETLRVVDSYFADLTLDAALNSDLMMLVLGECRHRQAGFKQLVERQDPNLLAALTACDNQQMALMLHDCEASVRDHVFSILGERGESVGLLLRGLEQNKQNGRSLRMQAKGLQRFMEQQVLVAELLCVDERQ